MSAFDTTFFYASPEDFEGSTVRLGRDEAHHVSRVLRLRSGDEIQVVDGLGGWYRVILDSADARGCGGRIVERRMGVGEPSVYLHLVVAGMKSRSRFDLVLEKGTELGVSRITVVDTARSERARVDQARATRLMRAAVKQCKRSRMPVLEGPVGVRDLLSGVKSACRIVCHDGSRGARLQDLIAEGDDDVAVLVGPESGFTDDEVEQAIAAGFEPASLGARRLRTETACLFACSVIVC